MLQKRYSAVIYIFLQYLLKCTKTNIYIIYPFYALQISVKCRSNLNQKLATFPPLWAPAPTKLQFSIIFFHWCVANQETNKTVPAISLFSNIFWIIYCQLFSCKIRSQSSSSYGMNNSLLGKTRARFCVAVS